MLTEVKAGPLTLRGVSLGGVYTSLFVPELRSLFDAGIAARSAVAFDNLFLSHAHADHVGSLCALLGARPLIGKTRAPKVFLPAEIEADLLAGLAAFARLQRFDLAIETVPLSPGDDVAVRGDLRVRALRTYHPVPSLAYELFRTIPKLRREFADLPGEEIGRRRRAGEDLFDVELRCELAYVTDTLVKVLDDNPSLYESRVLVLESTFLDSRKSRAATRAGCHIHLDEILERADQFRNEALVLMHFSQLYSPREVHEILAARCPPSLRERLVVFAPTSGRWPG